MKFGTLILRRGLSINSQLQVSRPPVSIVSTTVSRVSSALMLHVLSFSIVSIDTLWCHLIWISVIFHQFWNTSLRVDVSYAKFIREFKFVDKLFKKNYFRYVFMIEKKTVSKMVFTLRHNTTNISKLILATNLGLGHWKDHKMFDRII